MPNAKRKVKRAQAKGKSAQARKHLEIVRGLSGIGDNRMRRFAAITLQECKEMTGIRDRAELERAIQECLDKGFIERRCIAQVPEANESLYEYAVRLEPLARSDHD